MRFFPMPCSESHFAISPASEADSLSAAVPPPVQTTYAFGYSCEYEYAMEGDEWFHKKYDGFVIRGYEGTEAERYANDNGFTFIPIISTGPTPTEYGDANGDGSVNISDATEIQMYAAGLSEFNEAQLKYADVTGDGNVNIEDVTMIQKYIAKIIRTLDR